MSAKTIVALSVGLVLGFHGGAAFGAVPEFGSREGDLACVGLTQLGFIGAQASKPSYPQVVIATAIALGFYAGRASKQDPGVTKQDVDAAIAKLSLEEKNTYANICIKQAAALAGPQFATGPAKAP